MFQCSKCGEFHELNDLKEYEDNQLLCGECWITQHPQDFLKENEFQADFICEQIQLKKGDKIIYLPFELVCKMYKKIPTE